MKGETMIHKIMDVIYTLIAEEGIDESKVHDIVYIRYNALPRDRRNFFKWNMYLGAWEQMFNIEVEGDLELLTEAAPYFIRKIISNFINEGKSLEDMKKLISTEEDVYQYYNQQSGEKETQNGNRGPFSRISPIRQRDSSGQRDVPSENVQSIGTSGTN